MVHYLCSIWVSHRSIYRTIISTGNRYGTAYSKFPCGVQANRSSVCGACFSMTWNVHFARSFDMSRIVIGSPDDGHSVIPWCAAFRCATFNSLLKRWARWWYPFSSNSSHFRVRTQKYFDPFAHQISERHHQKNLKLKELFIIAEKPYLHAYFCELIALDSHPFPKFLLVACENRMFELPCPHGKNRCKISRSVHNFRELWVYAVEQFCKGCKYVSCLVFRVPNVKFITEFCRLRLCSRFLQIPWVCRVESSL